MTGGPERYVATSRADASLQATRHPLFLTLKALTPRASAWLIAAVGDDAEWVDGSVVVEHRYFPDLADAAFEAGFLFDADGTAD